ncbi:MAG TPA: right-handed parallel beta-helix repeat-containing protein [Pyrinomonadaceae bacterium]|nr:right-handed parallel beta-helix repeat-containing protein [Pyrinomonadaceae bacterium]
MTKLYPSIKALLVVSFVLTVAIAAQAQSRTWVSGVGDDMFPCSRTAPCKTFAGAISKTAKDGEISVLDPGGYGAVTITKSIYINGTHGAGYGSAINALQTAVNINITDSLDVRKAVRLRGLDLNGVSTGTNGVSILAANNVWIEDSVIDGNTGNGTSSGVGVRVNTTASCNVFISDTMIHKNVTGVRANTSVGFVSVSIKNCNIEGNTTGVEAVSGGFVTIQNSRVSGNTGDALKASVSGATINATDCVMAHNNGAGANAAASGATVRVASCNVFNNGNSFLIAAGGTVATDSQNRVVGNGGGVAPNANIPIQ